MRRLTLSIMVAVLIAAGLGGCGQAYKESWTRELPENEALLTTAAVRGVYSNTRMVENSGGTERQRVVCAEPSADVASAISKGFGAALTLTGKGTPAAGAPPVEAAAAASIGSSRAQAIAQLGERLATIQMLRDGLYRACEAYANGAISQATYTLIVSRIDDLMVTLLSTEIAGGAFGRELAALGGSATGAAAASQAVGTASEEVMKVTREFDEAAAKLAEEKEKLGELQGRRSAGGDEAPSELDEQIRAQQGEVDKAEGELDEKQEALLEAVTQLAVAQATHARASARASFSAGGGLDRAPTVEIAEQLSEIQKSYLSDVNADAVMAACISELSRNTAQSNASMLATECQKLFNKFSEELVRDLVKLRKEAQKPEVIEAHGKAEAQRLQARAQAFRFDAMRALANLCNAQQTPEKKKSCVTELAGLFGLAKD